MLALPKPLPWSHVPLAAKHTDSQAAKPHGLMALCPHKLISARLAHRQYCQCYPYYQCIAHIAAPAPQASKLQAASNKQQATHQLSAGLATASMHHSFLPSFFSPSFLSFSSPCCTLHRHAQQTFVFLPVLCLNPRRIAQDLLWYWPLQLVIRSLLTQLYLCRRNRMQVYP